MILLIPRTSADWTSIPPDEIIVVSGEPVNHPIKLTPEELVDYFSEEYGADPVLAKAIIQCESEWIREAQSSLSTASGYFQFLNSTWKSTMNRMNLPTETSKTHPIVSIQAGVWLLAEDGVTHWTESRPCWITKI